MMLRVSAYLALLAPATIQATQQPSPQPTSPPNVGERFVTAVIRRHVVDPSALTIADHKPLAVAGHWSLEKAAPPECEAAADCAAVRYTVPEQNVVCRWVVKLGTDDSSASILDEDESAVHYFVRVVPTAEAKSLVVTFAKAHYPPIAQAAHVSGKVVVDVSVDKTGTIIQCDALNGPPMLRGSALEAMKASQFKPLLVAGKPIKWRTNIEYTFTTTGPGSADVKIKP